MKQIHCTVYSIRTKYCKNKSVRNKYCKNFPSGINIAFALHISKKLNNSNFFLFNNINIYTYDKFTVNEHFTSQFYQLL